MENKTTIFLSKEVRDDLLSCKIYDKESHNEVIVRLIRFYKKNYVPVEARPKYMNTDHVKDTYPKLNKDDIENYDEGSGML